FLKTILIVLLIYIGLKFLLKWLSPYIMRFAAKKVTQKFESAFGQNPFQQNNGATQKEDTIGKTTKTPKSNGKVVGEYVDFEELE
ncbi:MAG: DUF4834 family protein, partial [Flavobacteriaceae bacterium]|nr:DUF4834 family protein [Flavobacteriaceae bacterium]